MKEHIYSIPLTEALEEKDCCILCRLEKDMEEKAVTYFLGPSMMEPDGRLLTNEKGFCPSHLKMLFEGNNRLSLALTLETHIKDIENSLSSQKPSGLFGKETSSSFFGKLLRNRAESCALCDKLSSQMSAVAQNLAFLWDSEEDFRRMFKEAPPLCLRHTALALCEAGNELHGKRRDTYCDNLIKMQKKALGDLYRDLHAFTLSFDYRNAGKELTQGEKESVINCVNHLK